MIKATGTLDGRNILMIGLSFGNLDKFRSEPSETFIRIDGKEMGLPIDVMIFSGETDTHCAESLQGAVGPDTKVYVDPKLRR